MKTGFALFIVGIFTTVFVSCNQKSSPQKQDQESEKKELTAKEILGNPNYLAVSYGGYRHRDHDIEPTIDDLKEDMRILFKMGIKIVRTYKVHFPHAANVLKAITQLKE